MGAQSLNKAIEEITEASVKSYSEQADYLRDMSEPRETLPKAGPNSWDDITDADYGQFYDFEILDTTDNRKIIYAASEAALQWCYAHLPEDCPRWRDTGFIVDHNVTFFMDGILDHMERDKLVDRAKAEEQAFQDWMHSLEADEEYIEEQEE